MTRALRIGLTGPIGCGKSTIASWLAEHGATVIDADHLTRSVMAPGEPTLPRVVEAFGPGVLQADGSLDRAALARVVFGDRAALRQLEAIIDPAVRPRILAAIASAEAAGTETVVVEAIRLVEGGYRQLVDELWLIVCDPVDQRVRLRARGLADDEAAARIGVQRDLIRRLRAHATRILDTTGSAEEAKRRAEAALAAALAARAGRGRRPAGPVLDLARGELRNGGRRGRRALRGERGRLRKRR